MAGVAGESHLDGPILGSLEVFSGIPMGISCFLWDFLCGYNGIPIYIYRYHEFSMW
jgi:hypothetical protein